MMKVSNDLNQVACVSSQDLIQDVDQAPFQDLEGLFHGGCPTSSHSLLSLLPTLLSLSQAKSQLEAPQIDHRVK